jgi:hypothetical protein
MFSHIEGDDTKESVTIEYTAPECDIRIKKGFSQDPY